MWAPATIFPMTTGAHIGAPLRGQSPTENFMHYQCPGCGYIYDESKGEPHEGFPAGTQWANIPDDWACPDCAVREKVDFSALS